MLRTTLLLSLLLTATAIAGGSVPDPLGGGFLADVTVDNVVYVDVEVNGAPEVEQWVLMYDQVDIEAADFVEYEHKTVDYIKGVDARWDVELDYVVDYEWLAPGLLQMSLVTKP